MTVDLWARSYDADSEWLKYALRSIQRFTTGFRRTIVVVPHGHNPPTGTNEVVFKVAEIGEQYLQQQSDKMHADHFTDAEFVTFFDSDILFTRPVSPSDLIEDFRKPRWLYTPYSSLKDDSVQVWKKVTEKFIGHAVDMETMRRHPFTVPTWALREMRAWCHKVHGVSMERYIMTQPNRECSEFNLLGSYLWFYHHDKIAWHNTEDGLEPPFAYQHWSYGGVTPEIRNNMEAALA